MSNASWSRPTRWNVVDTAIATIGVSIGLIVAVLITPASSAQVVVDGSTVTRSGQATAEQSAASSTLLVGAHEGEPLWGTGTVLRSGIVLTNAHVLGGGTGFEVVTSDGARHATGRAQRSTDTDLASGSVPPAVAASGLDLASHDPRPGDQVVIAGH